MTFNHPDHTRVPHLRRLWQTAFGDTDAFLDAFFSTAFSPERSLCAFDEGKLAGMLFWFDIFCDGRKMAYLYAVATDPHYRGRGVCRNLMEHTHSFLRARGYAGALLVPVDGGLRQMYAAFGYQNCTGICETFCAAGTAPAPLHRIDTGEFARLRRQLLPRGSVLQEGENLAFLETQVRFYKGTDFLLAAQPTEEGALFGTELLGNLSAAPGILCALGYPQGTFRTPGQKKPYAMFLPLAQDAPVPAYFAFSFD